MLDGVTDPLVAISRNYIVRRANKAYSVLIGKPFNQIIGRKCHELLRHRQSPCEDCMMNETFINRHIQNVDRSPHPNGRGAVSIHFTPCNMEDENENQYFIEHIRDITVLEELKTDLEKNNQSLASTMKHLKTAQQKVKDELRLARIIQQGILPKNAPEFDSLKMDLVYHPVTDVGGDIYDFIKFTPTRLGIFIGDASGHGLSSAFVGTISKMSLYHNSKKEIPVEQLIGEINKDLLNNVHSSHYVTCFWGIVDIVAKKLIYSRAGHPLPVLLKRNGTIILLESPGTFAGIIENAVYESRDIDLDDGDRLFLFTDGIYEALEPNSKEQEMLGYDRFVQLLKECNCLPFKKILPSLQHQLEHFSYQDDYTLILVEFNFNNQEPGK
jgi:serine phosphatase RsbU (regulator of sigma subunit)